MQKIDIESINNYLVTKNVSDPMNIKIKDIPDIVLYLMQYAEKIILNGPEKKLYVINAIKLITKNSRLSEQDLIIIDSLIDTYVLLDKSKELISIRTGNGNMGCCIIS